MSSDNITTLAPIGTVTPGPYTSGQSIQITGTANSTLNNANRGELGAGPDDGRPHRVLLLRRVHRPGRPGGQPPHDVERLRGGDRRLHLRAEDVRWFVRRPVVHVYDLPDPATLGSATMVGTCDVAPNTCVIGIFAENPGTAAVSATPTSSRRRSTSIGGTGKDLGGEPRRRVGPDQCTHFGDELDRRGQPRRGDGGRGEHLAGSPSRSRTPTATR